MQTSATKPDRACVGNVTKQWGCESIFLFLSLFKALAHSGSASGSHHIPIRIS